MSTHQRQKTQTQIQTQTQTQAVVEKREYVVQVTKGQNIIKTTFIFYFVITNNNIYVSLMHIARAIGASGDRATSKFKNFQGAREKRQEPTFDMFATDDPLRKTPAFKEVVPDSGTRRCIFVEISALWPMYTKSKERFHLSRIILDFNGASWLEFVDPDIMNQLQNVARSFLEDNPDAEAKFLTEPEGAPEENSFTGEIVTEPNRSSTPPNPKKSKVVTVESSDEGSDDDDDDEEEEEEEEEEEIEQDSFIANSDDDEEAAAREEKRSKKLAQKRVDDEPDAIIARGLAMIKAGMRLQLEKERYMDLKKQITGQIE